MEINWVAKLSSRKFWGMLAALITSVLVFFNVSEGTTSQVVAVVGAFGSIITYIVAESYVDVKRAGTKE